MPLSEHEERVLAELERAFTAEDPQFANSLRQGPATPRPVRRYLKGALGLLLGLGLLVLGAVLENVWVGVGGFVVMFAALAWALANGKPTDPAATSAAATTAAAAAQRASRSRENFMARMEERWDRRREGGR